MARKIRYATEEDIFVAEASGISKLNFGGNLYMRLDKRGYKYFQFRLNLNGRDTTLSIGKYPDMTLAQAREIAEKREAEVVKMRQKNMEIAFKEKLMRPKAGERLDKYSSTNSVEEPDNFFRERLKIKKKAAQTSSFRSMEDVGVFFRNIGQCKGLITDEMFCAIYLLILVPSRPADLLCAQWKDFNFQFLQWTINPGRANTRNSHIPNSHVAFLSKKAVEVLNVLRNVTGTSEYLFPTLFAMKKSDRDTKIVEAIQVAWPYYRIEPDGFRYFFKTMASKYSYFVPELIEAIVTQNPGNPSDYHYRNYVLGMHAIADWWSDALWWADQRGRQYKPGQI